MARISPNGFSMGILAIRFSLFCYSFIFYLLINAAISINVVGSKYKAIRQDLKILSIFL